MKDNETIDLKKLAVHPTVGFLFVRNEGKSSKPLSISPVGE